MNRSFLKGASAVPNLFTAKNAFESIIVPLNSCNKDEKVDHN